MSSLSRGTYIMKPSSPSKSKWETLPCEVIQLQQYGSRLYSQLENKRRKIDKMMSELRSSQQLCTKQKCGIESLSTMFYKVNSQRKDLAKELQEAKIYNGRLESVLNKMDIGRKQIITKEQWQAQTEIYQNLIEEMQSALVSKDEDISQLLKERDSLKHALGVKQDYDFFFDQIDDVVDGSNNHSSLASNAPKSTSFPVDISDISPKLSLNSMTSDNNKITQMILELGAKRADNHNLALALAECSQDLEESQSRQSNLEKKCRELEVVVRELEFEIGGRHGDLVRMNEETSNLQTRMFTLEKEIGRLQRSLEDSREETEVLRHEVEQKNHQMESLVRQLRDHQDGLRGNDTIQRRKKPPQQSQGDANESSRRAAKRSPNRAGHPNGTRSQPSNMFGNKVQVGDGDVGGEEELVFWQNQSAEQYLQLLSLRRQVSDLHRALSDSRLQYDQLAQQSRSTISSISASARATTDELVSRAESAERDAHDAKAELAQLQRDFQRLGEDRDQLASALKQTVEAARVFSQAKTVPEEHTGAVTENISLKNHRACSNNDDSDPAAATDALGTRVNNEISMTARDSRHSITESASLDEEREVVNFGLKIDVPESSLRSLPRLNKPPSTPSLRSISQELAVMNTGVAGLNAGVPQNVIAGTTAFGSASGTSKTFLRGFPPPLPASPSSARIGTYPPPTLRPVSDDLLSPYKVGSSLSPPLSSQNANIQIATPPHSLPASPFTPLSDVTPRALSVSRSGSLDMGDGVESSWPTRILVDSPNSGIYKGATSGAFEGDREQEATDSDGEIVFDRLSWIDSANTSVTHSLDTDNPQDNVGSIVLSELVQNKLTETSSVINLPNSKETGGIPSGQLEPQQPSPDATNPLSWRMSMYKDNALLQQILGERRVVSSNARNVQEPVEVAASVKDSSSVPSLFDIAGVESF